MYVASEEYGEIVRALIDNGADVNAQDNKRNTALSLAQKKGRTEIVKILKATETTSQ